VSGRRPSRAIAVALHDVEPSTFTRCALVRDWLEDLGIARATLLVIPAVDLHPFYDRRPELTDWLAERALRGDAIAQHGFQHRQTRRAGATRQWVAGLQGGRSAEFCGLDAQETHQAVDAGRRLLRRAGVETRGFVAPAYAYTRELREELAGSFEWWASLLRLHGRETTGRLSPAVGLGTSSAARRAASPTVLRAGSLLQGRLLRLDLHPADFDHPRHVRALEAVLRRSRQRIPVSYDDLFAG